MDLFRPSLYIIIIVITLVEVCYGNILNIKFTELIERVKTVARNNIALKKRTCFDLSKKLENQVLILLISIQKG